MDNFVIFLTFVSVLVAAGLIGSVAALWYRRQRRHR
jgi:hypothetical protein